MGGLVGVNYTRNRTRTLRQGWRLRLQSWVLFSSPESLDIVEMEIFHCRTSAEISARAIFQAKYRVYVCTLGPATNKDTNYGIETLYTRDIAI